MLGVYGHYINFSAGNLFIRQNHRQHNVQLILCYVVKNFRGYFSDFFQ